MAGIEPFTTEYWNECELPQPVSAGARFGEMEQTQYQEPTVIGKLYPNPATDEFYFEYKIEKEISGELIVYDVMGKQLCSYAIVFENNLIKINCANFVNGVYLVKITLSDGTAYMERLLINK